MTVFCDERKIQHLTEQTGLQKLSKKLPENAASAPKAI
jgi:hypothetical protein